MISGHFIGRGQTRRAPTAALLVILVTAACSAPSVLQHPRPLIVSSGARLPAADPDRLVEIHEWVASQLGAISCQTPMGPGGRDRMGGLDGPYAAAADRASYCMDIGSIRPIREPGGQQSAVRRSARNPAIHITTLPGDDDRYPWEALVIEGDTARILVSRRNTDANTAYTVYAYLQLLRQQGRLDSSLPETAEAGEFEVERAILKRVADTWLMGRASFALDPHARLDELLYASEMGHLDAFLLTARPEDFPEAREAWLQDNPSGIAEYKAWFRSTFDEDPPGVRAADRN